MDKKKNSKIKALINSAKKSAANIPNNPTALQLAAAKTTIEDSLDDALRLLDLPDRLPQVGFVRG